MLVAFCPTSTISPILATFLSFSENPFVNFSFCEKRKMNLKKIWGDWKCNIQGFLQYYERFGRYSRHINDNFYWEIKLCGINAFLDSFKIDFFLFIFIILIKFHLLKTAFFSFFRPKPINFIYLNILNLRKKQLLKTT